MPGLVFIVTKTGRPYLPQCYSAVLTYVTLYTDGKFIVEKNFTSSTDVTKSLYIRLIHFKKYLGMHDI